MTEYQVSGFTQKGIKTTAVVTADCVREAIEIAEHQGMFRVTSVLLIGA